MGTINIIVGHIQETWYASGDEENRRLLLEANRRVIESLPTNDEWPPLLCGMFSFPPDGRRSPGTYRSRVIHFGGSFREIWREWDAWLYKFEELLRRLYWESASVHLTTELIGHHSYFWHATTEAEAGFTASPPQPVQEWKFEGSDRSFG